MSARLMLADIRAAAARIAGRVVRTPLLENAALNAALGGRILLKPETLQHTGSFKVRGAFNRLLALPPEARARGVVAFSSGNHAQGVAYAARTLGMRAWIVMPADAPAVKLAGTRALGAELILYDRAREDREAIAAALAEREGATLVPSFEDPHVIAGQGTAGLEAAEDLAAQGLVPDLALVPVGGAGLIAGVAVALRAAFPGLAIWGVEPQGFDDFARSLALGAPQRNPATAGSVCDALLSPSPGALTLATAAPNLAGAVAVSDAQALAAVGYAARALKLVVEPGGAVALAALLSGRIGLGGRTALVVLSGGNLDPAMLARAVAAADLTGPGRGS